MRLSFNQLKGIGCCFIFYFSCLLQAAEIPIYIRDDVYIDYRDFVGERDITQVSSFSGRRIRRDVVDMIIAQQALKLGGFSHDFSYIPGRTNFRNVRLLEQGTLLMSFDSFWWHDAAKLTNFLYVTDPVIRKGEYTAGIYTSPQNEAVFGIQQLSDLSKFSAVSTPNWQTDWDTLSAMPLKELVREDRWLAMAQLVHKRWVDFMMIPLQKTQDGVFTVEKITLVPVPNVALILNDSRHFVISKNHRYGREAFVALEKGLKILRQEKRIVKAYMEAGFFIDQSKYNIINQSLVLGEK